MKECMLVIGPPRTGTSAVTGLLKLFGYDPGESAVPPGTHNPKGVFEDRDFFEVNTGACGSVETPAVVPRWTPELEFALKSAVAVRTGRKRPWAVKDPRLCMTAPKVLETCQEFSVTPSIIFTSRNAGCAAASLARLFGGLSLDEAASRYGRFVVAAAMTRKALKECPSLDVNYDRLVEDPWGFVVKDIATFCGLEEPPPGVAGWISPGLRHHRV